MKYDPIEMKKSHSVMQECKASMTYCIFMKSVVLPVKSPGYFSSYCRLSELCR